MTTPTRADRSERAGRGGFGHLALLACTALSLTLVTACSSSPAASQAATSAVAPISAAVVTTTVLPSSPKAKVARDHAITATSSLRSYTFTSASVLGTHRVSLQGRAVLPGRLAYVVVSGPRSESVVVIGLARYVRLDTGHWHPAAAKAAMNGSPTATLLAALRASTSLSINPAGLLVGQISAADATRVGLLVSGGSSAPLHVTFALDPAGHIVLFGLKAEIITAGRVLTLDEVTTYAAFDRASPITAP